MGVVGALKAVEVHKPLSYVGPVVEAAKYLPNRFPGVVKALGQSRSLVPAAAATTATSSDKPAEPMREIQEAAAVVPELAEAQERGGPQEVAAEHYVQSQTSPAYRRTIDELKKERAR